MRHNIRRWWIVLLALFQIGAAQAQAEELTLTLSRDWGYGGGRDIQGLFSLKVQSPANLRRVEFYLDDTLLAEDIEAPFRVQFNTDDYPLGEHRLYAIGYTQDGRKLESRIIQVNFVTAETGWKAAGRIVGGVFAIVAAGMLFAVVLTAVTGRRRTTTLPPGSQRTYLLGGGICAHCRRPFAFHLWGLNLMAGKLDRCPYCGKWGVVRRRSLEELRAAERAELASTQAASPDTESESERLKRDLEETRYQDL